MVFDRNAINAGRRINDFGLCDLKGIYQNTAKMRAKGFLAVAFLKPLDSYSISVAKELQDWASIGDQLSIVAVTVGSREEAEKMVADTGVAYSVLWDTDTYITPMWSVTSAPTLFIIDMQGIVLAKLVGANSGELAEAKTLLMAAYQKAEEGAKAAAEAAAEAAKPASAPPSAPAPSAAGKK